MTPAQLTEVDIALMNLCCAEGLSGSEKLDVSAALQMLDQYARHAETETARHLHRFREHPEKYENSEAYFRMLMLCVVLQQDYGVHYNPERATSKDIIEPNEIFFANSRDVFLHGLTSQPAMGTCSSMPVLYIAVGRRLGYPLTLVSTKCHLFVRWQDSRERLNMDGTSHGLFTASDNYYKNWPFKVTDEDIRAERFLEPMTPSEELACFLSTRAHCLMSMGNYAAALDADRAAIRLAPHIRGHHFSLAIASREVAERTAVFIPPDPFLQITGNEIDWAGRRAELLSRQRRNEDLILPVATPAPPDPFRQTNPYLNQRLPPRPFPR